VQRALCAAVCVCTRGARCRSHGCIAPLHAMRSSAVQPAYLTHSVVLRPEVRLARPTGSSSALAPPCTLHCSLYSAVHQLSLLRYAPLCVRALGYTGLRAHRGWKQRHTMQVALKRWYCEGCSGIATSSIPAATADRLVCVCSAPSLQCLHSRSRTYTSWGRCASLRGSR
jgi:hypothetical protein